MADLSTVMLFDCRTTAERDKGVQAAIEAVKRGDLIVMPTDTVYGIGADAFRPFAVTALQNAKGRGRGVPPPVLVGSRSTLDGLVFGLPAVARDLVDYAAVSMDNARLYTRERACALTLQPVRPPLSSPPCCARGASPRRSR